jgi:hypothetical protein
MPILLSAISHSSGERLLPFIPGAEELAETDEIVDGVVQAGSTGFDGTASSASDVVTSWGRFEGDAEPGPDFMEREETGGSNASGGPQQPSGSTPFFGDSDQNIGDFNDRDFASLQLGGNGSHDFAPWEPNQINQASFPDNMSSMEEYDRVLLQRTLHPLPPREEGIEGLIARIRENFPATFRIDVDDCILTLTPHGWEAEF